VDTSCGYGNFLRLPNSIGADIDSSAIEIARANVPTSKFFTHNSLKDIFRSAYSLTEKDKIIIIGNPPYNDTTSIIRNGIKKGVCEVDKSVSHRDTGVSFLISYSLLKADYISVLHPLSYLIKKANFESLGAFTENYTLTDGVIISSGEFSATSKTTQFPIIAALYKRGEGMGYNHILNYQFKTGEGRLFRVNKYDRLANYITKYPNSKSVPLEKTVAFFWTMRDINALKRTKTFVESEVSNSIRVPKAQLPYYCYADVFKDYIKHVPYYFGNSELMIDIPEFEKIKDCFTITSLRKYPFLRHLLPTVSELPHDFGVSSDRVIFSYFKNLLGEHYVD
jgi:hypothetical protein